MLQFCNRTFQLKSKAIANKIHLGGKTSQYSSYLTASMPWYLTVAASPFARVIYSRVDSLTIMQNSSDSFLALSLAVELSSLSTIHCSYGHASEGGLACITMAEIELFFSTTFLIALQAINDVSSISLQHSSNISSHDFWVVITTETPLVNAASTP